MMSNNKICNFIMFFFLILLLVSPLKADVMHCPAACRCISEVSKNFYPTIVQDGVWNTSMAVLVNCSHSDLTRWPITIPVRVVGILMDENKIKKLENLTAFSNTSDYTHVVTLSAKNNLLSQIDNGAFDSLNSLQTLYLSHNLLVDLAWTASLSNSRLVQLDLSFNSLDRISPSRLEPLKMLERLDLSHNYITFVERLSFVGFANLHSLDLSANMISTSGLQKESLSRLDSLTHLSVAENRPMTKIPNFVELGLDTNNINSLDMHGLPYVTTIESFAFEKLGSLQILNLSFCGIRDLKQGWLNGGPHLSIEMIDLSNNQLTTVDDCSFVALSTNQKLTDPNTYSDVPLDVASLPYIVSPSIGEAVQQVRPFTPHTVNLASLGAEWYLPLETLRWLSLKNNIYLHSLADNAFLYMPNLQYLFLQNCNISSMNLAASAFRFKTTAIRQTLPRIRAMWLYNNPVICDCYVREIRYEIDSSSEYQTTGCQSNPTNSTPDVMQLDPSEYFFGDECVQVVVPLESVCYLPQNAQMHWLTSVPMSYLRCPDEPMSLLIVMLIGPLIFVVSISVVMACGICSVFVRRARRYRSGKYHLMDEKMALTARDRVAKSNGKTHNQRPVYNDYSQQFKNQDSPVSQRSVYRTNLVMGGMRSQPVSGDPAIKFHIPSFFLPGARRQRSRSPSPATKKKLEFSQSSSGLKAGYLETCLGERVDAVSRSCPDVSGDVEKQPVEYWKHPKVIESMSATGTPSKSVNVNNDADMRRHLLKSVGRANVRSIQEGGYNVVEDLDDYERVADSLLNLPM